MSPIPDDELIQKATSREALFSLYAEQPWDWHRQPFETQWLRFDPRMGGLIVDRYLVDPSVFSCRCSGRDRGILCNVRPSGVYITCSACRKMTSGPIQLDKTSELLGSRRVSLKEAYEHLKRTGQARPPGIPAENTQADHLQNLFR